MRVWRSARTAPDWLEAIACTEWDVVIDTWDGAPRAVLDSARDLVDSAPGYVYVSSRSVYQQPVALGADESIPIVDGAPDAADGEYPQLKAGGDRKSVV